MADPEECDRNTVDLVLRHVSQRLPGELARALLGMDVPVTAVPYETQVTARQRRLDRVLDANVGGERRLLHVEWQSDMPDEVRFRVFKYHVMLALAVAAEAQAGKLSLLPVDSVVVLLGGRDKPWPAQGHYRTSSEDAPFCGVQYRIEAVYQQTVAELRARDSPFWMVFAALAADADESKLARVVEEVRGRTSKEAFEEIGVAMAILAEADGRKRGLGDVVRSLLPREIVMESTWLKEVREEGMKEGLEKGLEPLMHMFERRLARALTSDERTKLAERLREQGAERVGDVVFDLSTEELAGWLADKNGHG